MKQETKACIGIVAADPLRAIGLESILGEMAGLRSIALSMAEMFTEKRLALVVLDERSTGVHLADLLARLRRDRPEVKAIVLGESLDPGRVQAVIGAGAKGYLAETAGESEIRMAIEVVLDGSVWAPRKVLARLIEAGSLGNAAGSAGSASTVLQKMTPREMQVLELLMDGRANRDIAGAMGIDETTVKAHLGRMLRKTGASNRVELTLRAMEERA